ncbi:MAG: hypothetical protein NTW56_21335 [Alphaproteobacteria bacterium]|jgi:hypothetical protein|nr:hypothetical protein [Alphaproteobacteria bacterium]
MRWWGMALAAVMLAGCTPFAAFHAGTFHLEVPRPTPPPPAPLRVPDRPQ